MPLTIPPVDVPNLTYSFDDLADRLRREKRFRPNAPVYVNGSFDRLQIEFENGKPSVGTILLFFADVAEDFLDQPEEVRRSTAYFLRDCGRVFQHTDRNMDQEHWEFIDYESKIYIPRSVWSPLMERENDQDGECLRMTVAGVKQIVTASRSSLGQGLLDKNDDGLWIRAGWMSEKDAKAHGLDTGSRWVMIHNILSNPYEKK